MKKVLVGFGFVTAAALLVFKDYLTLPTLPIPLWILIVSAVFTSGALINLAKKDYAGSIGSLAILFIITNAYYDFLSIGTGTLVAALVLASLGFQFIFKKEESN